MPSVSCPCCGEPVRIPTATLPEHASLGCPWCDTVLPVAHWQVHLAPLATVYAADGSLFELHSLEQTSFAPISINEKRQCDATLIDQPISTPMNQAEPMVVSEPISVDSTDGVDSADEVSAISESRGEVPLVSLDEDELAGDSSLSQPSIEEIEQAWESRDGWETPESLSRPAVQNLDFDEDKFDDDEFETDDFDDDEIDQDSFDGTDTRYALTDPEQHLLRNQVPLENDQSPFDRRHVWGRKPRRFIRLLKIAAPTLVALPVIATILYFAGINLGLFASDQSLVSTTQQIEAKVDQSNHRKTSAANASRKESSSSEDRPVKNDQAAGDVDQLLFELAQSAKQGAASSGSESASGQRSDDDNQTENSSGSSPNRTIEMIAREQWLRRNPPIERGAGELQAELLNSATLAFPSEPPRAESVLQASAEADPEPELTPFPSAGELSAGELVAQSNPDAPMSEVQLPPTATEPAVDSVPSEPLADSDMASENSENHSVCEHAMELLDALAARKADAEQHGGQVSKEEPAVVLERLRAYRAVAEIGGLGLAPESSCIPVLFEKLAEPAIRTQLEPLCGEWINWRGRKTEGMLLIGVLRRTDDLSDLEIEFSDQTKISIRSDEPIRASWSDGGKYMALGTIIREGDRMIVQVHAAIELR